MIPATNAYWQIYLKTLNESQRAFTSMAERMNADHSSTTAVATEALESYSKFIQESARHPLTLVKQSAGLGRDYLRLVGKTCKQLIGKSPEPVIEPSKGDLRFADDRWHDNAWSHFLMQAYLMTSKTMLESIEKMPGLDDTARRRTEFFTRQLINALSPSNYVLTNPELLDLTIKSRGKNLIQGFERFVKDLESSSDALKISMTDDAAFELGVNIATTPGKVVLQTEMFELIQYTPTTEQVSKTPLLIVPPFVNKYYILDLSEKNSFVRWAVEQGHTVFLISWVNPTIDQRNKGFDNYVLEGVMAALEAVEEQTGEREVNAIGYCIGGSLLLTTLAYMAGRRIKSRVKSATLFTTLSDFSDPGDIGVFIDDHTVKAIEEQNNHNGFFDGRVMAVSFSKLRENSLYWNYYIQNYLKGESPMPFDLLYWNSDSTNITAACHNDMLRKFYIENQLVKPGAYDVNGTKIDLRKIKVPLYFVSTHQDHIAKWRVTYEGAKICKPNATFVLGESGHIAGIVNPPAKNKYSYWTGDDIVDNADEWLEHAEHHKGSWWLHWNDWMQPHRGDPIDARDPEQGSLGLHGDAPGSYVKRRLGLKM